MKLVRLIAILILFSACACSNTKQSKETQRHEQLVTTFWKANESHLTNFFRTYEKYNQEWIRELKSESSKITLSTSMEAKVNNDQRTKIQQMKQEHRIPELVLQIGQYGKTNTYDFRLSDTNTNTEETHFMKTNGGFYICI